MHSKIKTFLSCNMRLRHWQQHVIVGLALLTCLGLSACSEETKYSYFAIQVSIDPATVDEDMLRSIDTCTLTVEGDDQAFQGLPCDNVKLEVGTAEFSTNKQRGQLKFLVVMRDINRNDVARGESAPVAILPNTANMPITTMIVARAVNPAQPDAGAGMDTAPMASPDAAEAGTPADGPLADTAP